MNSPPISEYEKRRNANISSNEKLMKDLNLIPETSRESDKKQSIKGSHKCSNDDSGTSRRSVRIRLMQDDLSMLDSDTVNRKYNKFIKKWPEKRPPGSLECYDFCSEVRCKNEDTGDVETFFDAIHESVPPSCADRWDKSDDLKLEQIQNMGLRENTGFKISSDRLFSLAVHPYRADRILVAAGDKRGQIGLALVDVNNTACSVVEDSALFSPHNLPVNCLQFPKFKASKLFSCSYDATVRCLDLHKHSFEEVYRTNDDVNLCKFFDLVSPNTMLVALHYGDLAIVDLRTKDNSAEFKLTDAGNALRTLSVNKVKPDIFAVAGSAGTVDVYDIRYMNSNHVKQYGVYSFDEGAPIYSAFFSPLTGNRLLTCTESNRVMVYDVTNYAETFELFGQSHNNRVGPRTTYLKPNWHPKSEDIILCGSLDSPYAIEVFSVDEEKVMHTLEGLNDVCSITAVHDNLPVVCAADSCGNCYMWC